MERKKAKRKIWLKKEGKTACALLWTPKKDQTKSDFCTDGHNLNSLHSDTQAAPAGPQQRHNRELQRRLQLKVLT